MLVTVEVLQGRFDHQALGVRDVMTVKRMDNVGIVVDDIDAAIEFFTQLGLEPRTADLPVTPCR